MQVCMCVYGPLAGVVDMGGSLSEVAECQGFEEKQKKKEPKPIN